MHRLLAAPRESCALTGTRRAAQMSAWAPSINLARTSPDWSLCFLHVVHANKDVRVGRAIRWVRPAEPGRRSRSPSTPVNHILEHVDQVMMGEFVLSEGP